MSQIGSAGSTSTIVFDPDSPDYIADPYPTLRLIREMEPVHRSTMSAISSVEIRLLLSGTFPAVLIRAMQRPREWRPFSRGAPCAVLDEVEPAREGGSRIASFKKSQRLSSPSGSSPSSSLRSVFSPVFSLSVTSPSISVGS
jgi:hypothetical protein